MPKVFPTNEKTGTESKSKSKRPNIPTDPNQYQSSKFLSFPPGNGNSGEVKCMAIYNPLEWGLSSDEPSLLITGSTAKDKEGKGTMALADDESDNDYNLVIWDFKSYEIKAKFSLLEPSKADPAKVVPGSITSLVVHVSRFHNKLTPFVIVGSSNGKINVYNLDTRLHAYEYKGKQGHKKGITSLAIVDREHTTKDKERYCLVSTGADNIKIWAVQPGGGLELYETLNSFKTRHENNGIGGSSDHQNGAVRVINGAKDYKRQNFMRDDSNDFVMLQQQKDIFELEKAEKIKLEKPGYIPDILSLQDTIMKQMKLREDFVQKIPINEEECVHADIITDAVVYAPKMKCRREVYEPVDSDKCPEYWRNTQLCKACDGEKNDYCSDRECPRYTHTTDKPKIKRDGMGKGEDEDIFAGPLIITSGWDKSIILWEVNGKTKTGRTGKKKLRGHSKVVTCLALFDPKDGSSPILVSGSQDMTIVIWDLKTQTKVMQLPLEGEKGHNKAIESLQVFDMQKDGNLPVIVSGSKDGQTILWNLITGKKLRNLQRGRKGFNPVLEVKVFKDLERGIIKIVTAGSKSKNFNVWDLSKRALIREEVLDAQITHLCVYTEPPYRVPEGEPARSWIVVGDMKGKCQIFDMDFKLKVTLIGHTERINGVAVFEPALTDSPDEYYDLLVGTCSTDKKAVIWKVFIPRDDTRKMQERTLDTAFRIFHEGAFFQLLFFKYGPPNECKAENVVIFTASRKNFPYMWPLTGPIKVKELYGDPNKNFEILDRLGKIYEPHMVIPPIRFKTASADGSRTLHTNVIRTIKTFVDPANQKPMLVSVSKDVGENTCPVVVWDLDTFEALDTFLIGNTVAKEHTDVIYDLAVYYPSLRTTGAYCTYKGMTPTDIDRTQQHEYKNPRIITASYDKTAIMWDAITGKKIFKFEGHDESLTSVNVLQSPDPEKEDSLLITTSVDMSIMVWNLTDLCVVRRLYAHSERVCSTALFIPPPNSNEAAKIVTGGDDKKVIIWYDALYPFEFMPLQDTVHRAFMMDVREGTTKRIEGYSKKFSPGFWYENSDLFFAALEKGCHDFFEKFEKHLTYVVRHLGERRLITSYSRLHQCLVVQLFTLIESAILKEDLKSLKVILSAWMENLNKDIHDPLTQRLFHASYFLQKKEIIRLANEFPNEFLKFICKIKMVKAHHDVGPKKIVRITAKSKTLLASTHYKSASLMWENKIIENDDWINRSFLGKLPGRISKIIQNILQANLNMMDGVVSIEKLEKLTSDKRKTDQRKASREKEEKRKEAAATGKTKKKFKPVYDDGQQVTPLYLPLPHACDLDMLEKYVKTSQMADSVEIFKADVGITATKYVWQNFALQSHLAATHNYCWFVFFVTSAVYTFKYLVSTRYAPVTWTLQAAAISGVFMYIVEERRQFRLKNRSIYIGQLALHIFDNVWNMMDFLTYIFVLLGVISRIAFRKETETSRTALAFASLLTWGKVLYYMRPFASSGPLVSMIKQISKDITYFGIILGAVVLGFSQGFWLLNNTDSESLFGTVQSSILYTFMFLLEGADPQEFEGGAFPILSYVFLILFCLFLMVLMLNLLIALMVQSYEKIEKKGLGQWQMEQASIIVEDAHLHKMMVAPYVHILMYSSDVRGSYDNDSSTFSREDMEAEEHKNKFKSIEEDILASLMPKDLTAWERNQEEKERKAKLVELKRVQDVLLEQLRST